MMTMMAMMVKMVMTISPGNLNPVMIPGPVSVLVFAVGTVDCRSNPPLVAVSGGWLSL